MMGTQLSPSLQRAYRETSYEVAGVTIRIGSRTAAMDRLLMAHRRREAAFITAYNPLSRRKPPGWNRRMQSRLVQAVRRWPVLPAGGGWRRWHESHLVVFAPSRPIAVLARRYRQHGIVIVRLRHPARLLQTLLHD